MIRFSKRLSYLKQKSIDEFSEWLTDENYCMHWCVSLLTMQGLLPAAPISFQRTRKVYIRIMGLIATYSASITYPVGIYMHWELGINVITEQIACIFLFGAVALYIWCFHFNPERYERVLKLLELMLQCGRLYEERPRAIVRQTRLLSFLAVGSFFYCNGNTILFIALQLPQIRADHKFTFEGWYPVIVTEPPFYDLTLIALTLFEIAGQVVITISVLFLTLLLIQLIGQFKFLNHNLALALPSTPLVNKTLEEPLPNLSSDTNATDTKSVNQEQSGQLHACVIHHQEILRFAQVFEESFQSILLLQCAACVVPAVMAITLVTYAHVYDWKVLMFIALTIVTTLNLGVFCFLADIISTQSSLVAESVYASNWLEVPSGYRRSLLIVMARANRPVTLSVAGFIPLTNEQFVNIVRLTYSYFLSIRTYLITRDL